MLLLIKVFIVTNLAALFYVRFLLESIWEENFLMNTAVQNY